MPSKPVLLLDLRFLLLLIISSVVVGFRKILFCWFNEFIGEMYSLSGFAIFSASLVPMLVKKSLKWLAISIE